MGFQKYIFSLFQTNDLKTVYRGVKFTCHFTLNEVTERWNALMYEPIISKLALSAIKNLHPEVVLAVQRRALFSKAEQDLLSTINANRVRHTNLVITEPLPQNSFCFLRIPHLR